MEISRIYDAPSWTDSDGSVWSKHISAVSFINKDIGWVVGSGQISYTMDGGMTWANQFNKQMARGMSIPKRVFGVDDRNAWVLMLADRSSPSCYFTRNGGAEWQALRLDSMVHPNDMCFVGENGWLISDDGEIPAANAMIHTTLDGGSSWRAHDLEIKGRPSKVRFLNSQKGFLVQVTTNDRRTTTISNLLITEDAGRSWRVVKSFNRRISDLYLATEDHFWVIGEGGFIARTTTGGLNWNRSRTPTNLPLNTITSDGHRKIVVGGDSGVLLVSEDFGEQWSSYEGSLEFDHFVDACFLENNSAICATSTAAFLLAFR
ncbi:MAG TPA: YCF48-related protein [Pyrinomonadaceae bacterium]|nr:YCF48-related protein [Pyrinomonadaceae bacterium]